MGLTITRLFSTTFAEEQETRILMVGLDAAGKTSEEKTKMKVRKLISCSFQPFFIG